MDSTFLFLVAWFLFLVIIITVFYITGKNALKIFPRVSSQDIIYLDYFASGYSTLSIDTKMGGASKVLQIIVTKDELWIKSNVFFAGIIEQYDLLHKIKLNDITCINKDKKKIIINFNTNSNKSKQIVIVTKDQDKFIRSIKYNTKPYHL
ncbi:MAG TPA: hypothetical protein PLA16_04350 [Chitinophagales bacterium]|nr:hypothetical protein [Chitinophagales bacterium]